MAENGWGQKGMVRGQRGDLERRSLDPFTGHPMDTMHYQEGGEEEGEGEESGSHIYHWRASGFQQREGRPRVLLWKEVKKEEGSGKRGGARTSGVWGTWKRVR